jgi:hypothetical protein
MLYVNDITGRIACVKHVGYTAQTSIEAGNPSPHVGIDGYWEAITEEFLALDFGFTTAGARHEAGIEIKCEEC